MLLAQVMIPAAAAAAVLFAGWFALDALRRDQGSERARLIAAAIQQCAGAVFRLQLATIAAAALVAAAAAALVTGYYEDSLEIGAIAAGAALAGALTSVLAVYLGAAVAGRATTRVATAGADTQGAAFGTALSAAAVSGLLAPGLNLAGMAGAFAIVSRLLGHPVAQVPYFLVAFALGAGVVALVARVGGGTFANAGHLAADLTSERQAPDQLRNPATAAALAGEQAIGAGAVAGIAQSMGVETVAGMLLGVSLFTVTGDIEWVLLPLVARSIGLFATIAGVLASHLLAFRAALPMALVTRGLVVTAVLSAAGLGPVTWAMLDDAWYWFFASGVLGVAAGPALVLFHRPSGSVLWGGPQRVTRASRTGPASNIITGTAAGFEATAISGVVVALVLGGAYALGAQADIPHASDTASGLFAVAMAAGGLLMPGGFVAAIEAFGSVATVSGSVERLGAVPAPETPAVASPVASAGPAAGAAARGYGAGVAGVAVVLVLLAFLEVSRSHLASVAVDDPGRYASLAQDLDLLAPGEDVKFAAANAVASAVARLEELRSSVADDERFGAADVQRLAVASRPETEGIVAALVDRDDLTPREGSTIEPGPLPLPRVLPLSFSRAEVVAAGFIGVTLVFLVGAAIIRAVGRAAGRLIEETGRQQDDPAVASGESEPAYARAVEVALRAAQRGLVSVTVIAIAVPLVVGLGLRYAFGGDGNEGWLAVAGLVLASGIAAVLVASYLGASGSAWARAHAAIAATLEVPPTEEAPTPFDEEALAVAAVGNTVGETFRDAVAPALLVVAMLMGAAALAVAPLFIG